MLSIDTMLKVIKAGDNEQHFFARGPYVPLIPRPALKEELLASAAPVEIIEDLDVPGTAVH